MLQSISNSDLQMAELGVLREIDKFCRTQGIHYSLYYGSMLGAIRHKGFIPWDDDVDIAMPRPDYDVFIRTFKNDDYIVKSIELDPDWPFPFAKCMDMNLLVEEHLRGCAPFGAYVDVFPIDGLPDDPNEIKKKYRKNIKRWRFLQLGYKPVRKHAEKNIIKILGRFCVTNFLWFNRKRYMRKILADAIQFPYVESNYVGVQTIGTYQERNCLEKKKLGEYKNIQFEEYQFYIFEGYDYILRQIYGDYMKLPPEDKRITHQHELRWNNGKDYEIK